MDATLQALKAFLPKRPIVMLGGDDKGTDLAELVDSCRTHAKAVVCYGAAGPRFHEAMAPLSADGVDVALEDGFAQAFARARASFDEFSCFEERGMRFKELVRGLEG